VSRFFVISSSQAVQPCCCVVCGTIDRPLIDFGVSIRGYGAIYFCSACVVEASSVATSNDVAFRELQYAKDLLQDVKKEGEEFVAQYSRLASSIVRSANKHAEYFGGMVTSKTSEVKSSDDEA
jgi:hypothetical protein